MSSTEAATHQPAMRVPATAIQGVAWHVGLIAATLLLLVLAFPRPGWSILAYIAIVPAGLLALRSPRPRLMLLIAFLGGWAWWLVMVHWLIPVTFGGYVAVAAFLGLYFPLQLLAMRLLSRRLGLPMLLALPLAWVSLELLRGWAPQGGWGWFTLGSSQAPFRPGQIGYFLQVTDAIGEYGLSFLVAMTSGLVLDLITRPWFIRTGGGRPRLRRAMALELAAWSITYGAVWAYGLHALEESRLLYEQAQHTVAVAVVQTNEAQSNKDSPDEEVQALRWQLLLDLTRQAAAMEPRPQLIIWPETVVPAALNEEALIHYQSTTSGWRGREVFDQQIRDLARSLEIPLLVGAPSQGQWSLVPSADGKHMLDIARERYNSSYLYHADGRQAGQRYDKIHRVPFGEYIPWVEGSPYLKGLFIRYLSPYPYDYSLKPGRYVGHLALPVMVDGQVQSLGLATPICFEDTVGRLVRRLVWSSQGKADLLVNQSNDGWFAGSPEAPQHLQLAALRCVENRLPMARSVNTGISGFIDSAGRIGPVVRGPGGEVEQIEGVLSATLVLDHRQGLYARVGLWPVIAVALLTCVLLVVAGRRRDTI